MIGSSLRALGRKLLRNRHLKIKYCPMRRWLVRPCLEALEVRTLPSTASFAPASVAPAWVAPAPVPARAIEGNMSVVDAVPPAIDSGNLGVANGEPDASSRDVPGLDRLLQDLGQQSMSVQVVSLNSGPANVTASAPDPKVVLPRQPQVDVAVDVELGGGDALSPPPAPRSARPLSTPTEHGPANTANPASAAGTVIPGFAEVATPAPNAPTTGGVPAVTTCLPAFNGPSTDDVAGSWALPQARAGRDAASVPAVAELQAAFAAWQNPDEAATPVQATPPDVPTGAVWEFSDAGPAAIAPMASLAPPLDSTEAGAIQAGVSPWAGALTDGALLQRFVAERDQAAFTSLVARYDRLVFSICQRVLGDAQAAEDAVQATFMILARKAGGLDPQRPLIGWLYMVAYHLALRLRAVAARRRRCEMRAARSRPSQEEPESTVDLENQEIYQVLREELQRLPEKHRVPLVLCYLQGQTHAEAADTIGMPRGSMAKRVGEGLERLRQRLTDRGIAS
jgi:RNA polymerase sigma factor (sigma-70 family)